MGNLIGQFLPGKSWLSLDVGELATGGSKDLGLGGNTLDSSPLAALKLLTQSGNTVTDLGPATLNGTSVEGYSVKMNPKVIEDKIESAKLPELAAPGRVAGRCDLGELRRGHHQERVA